MARRLALGPDQRNKSTLLLVLLAIVLLLATVFALTTVSAASTSLRAAAAAATKVAVFVATTDDSYVLAAIATLENVRAQNPAASLRRSRVSLSFFVVGPLRNEWASRVRDAGLCHVAARVEGFAPEGHYPPQVFWHPVLPRAFLERGFAYSLALDADVASLGPMAFDELLGKLARAEIAVVPEASAVEPALDDDAGLYFNTGVVAYNNKRWVDGGWDEVYRLYYATLASRRETDGWADHVSASDQGLLVCLVRQHARGTGRGPAPEPEPAPAPELAPKPEPAPAPEPAPEPEPEPEPVPGCRGDYHDFGGFEARRGVYAAIATRRGPPLRVARLGARWNVQCWQGLSAAGGCLGLYGACDHDLRHRTIFYHFTNCPRPERGCLASAANTSAPDVCQNWADPDFEARAAKVMPGGVPRAVSECDREGAEDLHARAFVGLSRAACAVGGQPREGGGCPRR